MVVDAARMRENLELTYGALFSQRRPAGAGGEGLTRDDAYRIVQRLAQRALDERVQLRELLAADPAGAALDLDAIFDYAPFIRYADEIVGRLDAIDASGRLASGAFGAPTRSALGLVDSRPGQPRPRSGDRLGKRAQVKGDA